MALQNEFRMSGKASINNRERRFRELYSRYYPAFCLHARRYIDDAAVCEDLVSDIFTNMWDRLDDMDLESPACVAYIKMSVKNGCLNYLKHHRHKAAYEDSFKKLDEAMELGPDSVYSLEELYKVLYDTLGKMPEQYRQVFMKSMVEDKTYAEIAGELNISVKSVNRYKKKTLELLKAELKDFLPLLLFLLSI